MFSPSRAFGGLSFSFFLLFCPFPLLALHLAGGGEKTKQGQPTHGWGRRREPSKTRLNQEGGGAGGREDGAERKKPVGDPRLLLPKWAEEEEGEKVWSDKPIGISPSSSFLFFPLLQAEFPWLLLFSLEWNKKVHEVFFAFLLWRVEGKGKEEERKMDVNMGPKAGKKRRWKTRRRNGTFRPPEMLGILPTSFEMLLHVFQLHTYCSANTATVGESSKSRRRKGGRMAKKNPGPAITR